MSINNACLPFCCLCPAPFPLLLCLLSASCASFNVECCVWFLPRLPSCHSWWHVRQLNDKGCKCELGVGKQWKRGGEGSWIVTKCQLCVNGCFSELSFLCCPCCCLHSITATTTTAGKNHYNNH